MRSFHSLCTKPHKIRHMYEFYSSVTYAYTEHRIIDSCFKSSLFILLPPLICLFSFLRLFVRDQSSILTATQFGVIYTVYVEHRRNFKVKSICTHYANTLCLRNMIHKHSTSQTQCSVLLTH